jgi:SAM-dependent methyltransferase
MENTGLFTGKSDDYARFRPSYPAEAIDWLRSRTAGERLLDAGAGTGIFTQLLLKKFAHVTALEPNPAMREKFNQLLPGVPCLDTTAEATGLADASVDLITVAQAFHWLDGEKFKAEAMRILAPEGKTAIVWNTTLTSDFTAARNKICQKYCPRFRAGYAGKRSPAEGDDFLRHHYFKKVEVVSFDNPFFMDKECFEGNMRSRSYSLLPGDEGYEAFITELRELFTRYAQNGIVTEPQETQIFLGEF